ncbi:hypothetical protein BaRGS_00016445 [Batillaria attramentaria]|uniref:Uncharacterized protein n=1 Tax=Batillaria attramentaria TaxID=370345 RepID=A0ABD0KZJ2_9CAEN
MPPKRKASQGVRTVLRRVKASRREHPLGTSPGHDTSAVNPANTSPGPSTSTATANTLVDPGPASTTTPHRQLVSDLSADVIATVTPQLLQLLAEHRSTQPASLQGTTGATSASSHQADATQPTPDAQVADTVQNTLDTTVANITGNGQLASQSYFVSASTAVTAHVPIKTKEKIWAGEFIDFQ